MPGMPPMEGLGSGALPYGIPSVSMLPGNPLPIGGGIEAAGDGIEPGLGPNKSLAVHDASAGSKAHPASDGPSGSPSGPPVHLSKWGSTLQMGSSGVGVAIAGTVAPVAANATSAATTAALIEMKWTIEAMATW